MKLSFLSSISIINSILVLILGLAPFAPEIHLQDKITTKTEYIDYSVQNEIGFFFEMHYFRIEKEQDGVWVCLQPLDDSYNDIGYPIQLSLQKREYRIDLNKVYGSLLLPGKYRIHVQQSYDNDRLKAIGEFTVVDI